VLDVCEQLNGDGNRPGHQEHADDYEAEEAYVDVLKPLPKRSGQVEL
jgi:hypothetical protein